MRQIFYEINSTKHHIEFLLNYYVKQNQRINTIKVWHYLLRTNKVINLNQTSNGKQKNINGGKGIPASFLFIYDTMKKYISN